MDEENLINPELINEEENRLENSLRPKNAFRIHRTNKSKRKYESVY